MPTIDRTKAQATSIPHVVDELCRVCGKCVARRVCRTKAIVQIDRDEPPFIDASLCYGCRVCIPACPHGAIVLNGNTPSTP